MPWFQRKRGEEDELKAGLRARARKSLLGADAETLPAVEPGPPAVQPYTHEAQGVEPAPEVASTPTPIAPPGRSTLGQAFAEAYQAGPDTSTTLVSADAAPAFEALFVDEAAPLVEQATDSLTGLEATPDSGATIQDKPRPHARSIPMVFTGAYTGTDLTLFIGKRGRAIGFGERPLPVHAPGTAHAISHFGRHLTLHRNRKGLVTPVHELSHIGPIKPVNVWLAIWLALRWLFNWRIKILVIERYVFGEAIGFFLLGAMGFTFFMIVTSIFSLGEKIFSKHIPPFTITKVLVLSAPAFLVLAIPVAVLFSTLMAMGRLNRDNEIVAMATNGVSLYRIFIPFITIAFIGGMLTWLIYEYVVPPNNREYKNVLKVFWEAQVTQFIKPQIVIKAPQKKYFYVEWIDKQEQVMHNLRLYDYYGDAGQIRHFPRMYIAKSAWIEDGYLVLSNVRLYNLDPNSGNSLVSAAMPEVKIDIGTQLSDYQPELFPQEMTVSELRLRINLNRDRLAALNFPNDNLTKTYLRDWTEYYFKYSIPVACLVLVLVAVPVSLRGPRDERNLGIILSFMLMMVYYVIYFSCKVLGYQGPTLAKNVAVGHSILLHKGADIFPPYVAGWLPAAVFFVWGAFLIWRARK